MGSADVARQENGTRDTGAFATPSTEKTSSTQTSRPEQSFVPSAPISADSIPAAPTLSLPKGGGAIRGIGEKSDVNLCTGAASASIPIYTSAGRADFTPKLALTYSSSNGNGPFGLGWQLSTARVSRKTDKGLPRYCDFGSDEDSDVFVLSGMEDLVPLFKRDASNKIVLSQDGKPVIDQTEQDGFLVCRYASRVEGQFNRIERWTSLKDSNDMYWKTITSQNITSVFGRDSSSRICDTTSGSATLTFAWLISEMYDTKGNAILFEYKTENSDNVPVNHANELNRTEVGRSSDRYIKTIKYGNDVPNRKADTWEPMSALSLPATAWKFSIVFDYGEHDQTNPQTTDKGLWKCRLDPFSKHRSCFEVRTYRLCRRVLMFHHFAELDRSDYLVASTDLTYMENPRATFLTGATQAGYVWETGASAYTRKALPPIEYGYAMFPSDEELAQTAIQQVDADSLENLPIGLDGKKYQWVDLDGEGISGLLTDQDGSWYYKRNTSANNSSPAPGDGNVRARLDPLQEVSTRPVTSKEVRFEDVSGTGKLELVETASGFWGYFERTEEGEWLSLQTFTTYPNLDTKDSLVKYIDLTGDGLADILICSDQIFYWHESLGTDGYGPGNAATQPNSEEEGPCCIFADNEETIYLADMSGDGLSDLVRIRNNDVCYWPNVGYGRFGALVRMDNAPCFAADNLFSHKMLRLADIAGSGTTDLLYFGNDGVEIYLNESGNGFSDKKVVPLFAPVDNLSSLNVVDLLGNGTMCIVWSTPDPAISASSIQYVDLVRGKKLYMLEKIVNNLGSEKLIHYAPSTRFYLDDKEAGTPWITRLPFPVQCVDRTELRDKISGNRFVSRFSYHHGFYDGYEREFRGFARVEQWDTEEFALMDPEATNLDLSWHVPPVHTKTWFHTGAFLNNQVISRHLSDEYFSGHTGNFRNASYRLEDSVIPPDLDGLQQIEALRALKGQILRTEVYADDGGDKTSIPYSISEANFTLETFQDVLDAHRHAVYFVHPRETISFQTERELDDHRVQHDMTLDVDAFNNVRKSLKIAYGRQPGKSSLNGGDRLKQETNLIIYSEFEYTNKVDTRVAYRTPVPCESRQYELTGLQSGPDGWFHLPDLTQNSFALLSGISQIPFETTASGGTQKRLIKRNKVVYRKDDLSSLLPLGKLESMALVGQVFELALTPGLVSAAFGDKLSDPAAILRGSSVQQAGYIDLDGDSHWWKPSGTVFFSKSPNAGQELTAARQNFFSLQSFVDPFGNVRSISYDDYHLFPARIQDSVGNITSAVYDYRVLQPSLVISETGTRSTAAFNAMGVVVATAITGNLTEDLGDDVTNVKANLSDDEIKAFFEAPSATSASALLGDATTRVLYDRERYWKGGPKQPAYTVVITRQRHVKDANPASDNKIGILFTYSDGFGRDIQAKKMTKAGPLIDGGPIIPSRWIGSGWTIFNNKGKPVKQYEPFFDDTHDFKFDTKIGVSPTILYDPLMRVVGTLKADRSIEKTIFSPWSQISFDSNDTVLISDPRNDPDLGHFFRSLPEDSFRSLPEDSFLPSWSDERKGGALGPDQRLAATKVAAHANTPRIGHFDVLGRSVVTIDDNGADGKYSKANKFDVVGNVLETIDAMNRLVMQTIYDLGGSKLRESSMDSGVEWLLKDVLGEDLYRWNNRGFRFRTVYDASRRPIELWLQEGIKAEILIEKSVWGEISPEADLYNLRGKIWQLHDQAGLLTHSYDSKGNLTKLDRQFTQKYKDVLDQGGPIALDAKHSTLTSYDALNHPIRTTTPDMSTSYRVYNENGLLEKFLVNVRGEKDVADVTTWTPIIANTDFNAKAQATVTNHGNGTVTTRNYDKFTFRLSRQRSNRGSDILQDLNYTYDPVGNVTFIRDSAQQTIFFRNARVEPSSSLTYDAVYQLISASGREHLGQSGGPTDASGQTGPFDPFQTRHEIPGDGNAMGVYFESYKYDPAGNILTMSHDGGRGWTRHYSYNEPSLLEPAKSNNQLSSTRIGSATEEYKYDAHGNMVSMGRLKMTWDFKNQMRSSTAQTVNDGTPETTFYVYDTSGQRVRKITDKQSGHNSGENSSPIKSRFYFANFEIFQQFDSSSAVSLERVTFQISTSGGRVADIETRVIGTDDGVPRQTRYQLANHLGSATIELDDSGQLLSYEEFTPFGSSSYHAVSSTTLQSKRYRFSGKELDPESGLYYFGARYYSPQLGRWTAPDPLNNGHQPYVYTSNNPCTLTDPDGRQNQPPPAGGGNTGGAQPPAILPGGWIPGETTGAWGSRIHKAALTTLAYRSFAELNLPALWEVSTTEDGSRNVDTEERGRVDFVQFPLGPFLAQIYDLKPKTSYVPKIKEYQTQLDHYVEHGLEDDRLAVIGMTPNSLVEGTFLAVVERLNPRFFRPIYFSVGDYEVRVQVSVAKTKTGQPIPGLLFYEWWYRLPTPPLPVPVPVPVLSPEEEAQKQQIQMQNTIRNLQIPVYGTPGAQAAFGGRVAGGMAGGASTVVAGGVLLAAGAVAAAPAVAGAGATAAPAAVVVAESGGIWAGVQAFGAAAGAFLLGRQVDKGK